MKTLIDILHILLCDKNHPTDMMAIVERSEGEFCCYYDLENDIAEGDTMPDHIVWKEKTEGFKIGMGFTSDQEALDFVKEALKISHQINSLSSGNSYRASFIKQILNM